MMPLKTWLASPEIRRLKGLSKGQFYEQSFHRDPLRTVHINPKVFYSPADGIILHALDHVEPTEPIVAIKGKKFTPQDALDDKDYNLPSLVVSVFMTRMDVHINRVPTSGYLSEVHKTPYLFTPNISMKLEEDALLDEGGVQDEDLGYLFANERRISRIYAPQIKCSYYLIQIAERDVDEILNWDYEHYTQGERFGLIRFGSQCTIVLPLKGDNQYRILTERNMHVEAGIDPIIEIL